MISLSWTHTLLQKLQTYYRQDKSHVGEKSSRAGSLYPGCEVHSSSSVQQQGGDIHITIVSRDVQRGEPTLFEMDREERDQGRKRQANRVERGERRAGSLKQQLWKNRENDTNRQTDTIDR